jgi:hypothetical protein
MECASSRQITPPSEKVCVLSDIRYTSGCENRAVLHRAHGLGRQMVRRTYSAMIPALAMTAKHGSYMYIHVIVAPDRVRSGKVPLDETHV